MTDAPTPAAASTGTPTPLDEVMLAMDVVDVLRHQQALVDQELNEEERERQLVARIRAIYAAQGIDVSDEVIAKGVLALKQDRFTYRPPERTFSVRLAEIYVNRGTWGRRLLIVALIVSAVVAWRTISRHRADTRLVEDFRTRLAAVDEQETSLDQQLVAVTRTLDRLDQQPAGTGTVAAILADARRGLAEVTGRLAAARGEAQHEQLTAEAYPADRGGLDAALEHRRTDLVALGEDLARIQGSLQAVERLRNLGGELERAVAGTVGLELSEPDRQALQALRQRVGASVEAGDEAAAQAALAELRSLVALLDQSYELRIVSGPDVQSGVWRELEDRPGARNYYVIVEAIDDRGRPLALPVKSEEDGTTRTVARFGIRVPPAVYESVKADKLDNGIIDRRLFGTKRRGARDVEYRFEVAGGRITEW